MWKLHRVFVAIDLLALGQTIGLILIPGEAARITGPHVPLGRPFGHPFRQNLARAPRLTDAKGEGASLIGIRHPRHRPNQGVAVGRIRDRPVDHLGQPRRAQQRHPRHGIGDIPLQPLQIVGEQLEREIRRKGVVCRHPMRPAVPLIGPQIEPVLLLPQVIRRIHIAQQRQLLARRLRQGRDLGHRVEQHVLMAHHHHRQVAPEPFRHFARVIARRVHHHVAANFPLRRRHNPLIPNPPHPQGWTKPLNPPPQRPRALGQRLGQLRRINVAVIRVVQCPRQVMGFQKRIAPLDLARGEDLQIHPLMPPHAHNPLKFLQTFPRMPQPHRPRHMVIHRIVNLGPKPAIKPRRIPLHVHDRPGRRKRRHIPRRMPCAARRQLVLFQQHAIRPTRLAQMIQAGNPHSPAANDHDAGGAGKV